MKNMEIWRSTLVKRVYVVTKHLLTALRHNSEFWLECVPEAGNVNAPAREGCEHLANTHLNKCPKGLNDCAPRWGAIAIFAF